jgi:hypothetical protein
MQLEAICGIAVGDLSLEVGGQVDDVDGPKGTFLWADTATDAKAFRDESNLGLCVNLNAELACADHRARLFAFLAAFLNKLISKRAISHLI